MLVTEQNKKFSIELKKYTKYSERLQIINKKIKENGEMFVCDPFKLDENYSLLLWKNILIVSIDNITTEIFNKYGKRITSCYSVEEIKKAKKYVERKKNIISEYF